MGRRRRELAKLEVLARRVWGDGYYEQYMRAKRSRWSRVQAAVGIGVGVPMLLTASLLSLFVTAASAHNSTINISCPRVEFVYTNFPDMTAATSHETVTLDGVEIAQRDFTFVGPTGSDTIAISVPSGTHTVEATAAWTFDGAPRGSASDRRELSECSSTSTTTAPEHTTTTIGSETSTSPKSTTTSTTMPGETTTTSPKTTTTIAPSTSTAPSSTTTTTGRGTTTTTGRSTTSTSSPVHPQGSTTTTTSPVHPHGSTVPPQATTTMSPPNGKLPFTGSGGRQSLVGGLFAVGVGLLALGLTSLRRARAGTDSSISD